MLVRTLLGKLDTKKVIAAHLVSTQLDAPDMLRVVAAAFGLPIRTSAKSDLLLALEMYMVSVATEGKRILLIVDEAQNLTPRAIEELRMLSNFQLDGRALLQSFLIGQPEFRETMQSPDMQQFCQRIIASFHMGPMNEAETRSYVEHRLQHVGWKDRPHFHRTAFQAIFERSAGVPRRINTLCDRLLLAGYLGSKDRFLADDVNEVAAEIKAEIQGGAAPTAGADSDRTVTLASTSGTRRDKTVSTRSAVPGAGAFGIEAANLENRVMVLEQTLAAILERLPTLVAILDRLPKLAARQAGNEGKGDKR
jgi:type II secretory pathway predicted ATPase ExeA